MIRHIGIVWFVYVALAQEAPPIPPSSSSSGVTNLPETISTTDMSTSTLIPSESSGSSNNNLTGRTNEMTTTLTTISTTAFVPTPKLFWVINVVENFIFFPSPRRQGNLYMGDISVSEGKVSNLDVAYAGRHPSTLWAVSCDYRRKLVYYTDYKSNYFGSYNVETGETTRLFQGLSFGIEGIATDWFSGNVYWIDIDLRKIVVADPSLKYITSLVDIDSDIPAKIAVNPLQNSLYWSETGTNSSRIYRSDLSGRNVTLLHELFDAYQIDALAIDVEANRLYWSDRSQTDNGDIRASVKSIQLDDHNRISIHYRILNGALYGLASSGNYLYIANAISNSLISVSRTTLQTRNLGRFQPSVTPYSMTIFSAEAQPWTVEDHEAHPCSEHSCEQICLTDGFDQHRCACQIGDTLQPDGRSCRAEILTGNFILVIDDKHSRIYQLSLEDETRFTVLPIPGLDTPISVDYDHATQKIYWYDLEESKVYRSFLNGSDVEVFIDSITATFIVIEPDSRNLYIVNNVADAIEVASLDLPNVTSVLHVHDIHRAWQMVIDHTLKKIYWSDWGQSATDSRSLGLIESIEMDGSNRAVVVGDTQSPRALALDEENQILYWSEIGTDKIAWFNLRNDQTGEATLNLLPLPFVSKRINGLDYYDGSLYIADLNRPTMYRVATADVLSATDQPLTPTRFGPNFFTVTGIKIVRESPIPSAGSTECATNRGNCPEICLMTPSSETECVCQQHSEYSADSNTCVPVHDSDDETAPTFGNTCPQRNVIVFMNTDLCSRTRIYNFSEPIATDDSGREPLLKRSYNTPPPYNLTEGFYVFSYTANDQNGNVAVCSINAVVQAPITCSRRPVIPRGGEDTPPTCGNLRGSVIYVHCYGRKESTFQYTCNRRGAWQPSEPPICFPLPTSTPTVSSNSPSARGGGLSSGGIAAVVIVMLVVILVVVAVFLVRRYRRDWLYGAIFWQKKDDHVHLAQDFDQNAQSESNIYSFK